MATRQANLVNPNAEIVASSQCLMVNVSAARGLQSVLKTNLGPRGTLKMLVGGAGQIKITKDGRVLLHEMQIQHPTAMMIARAATAMDDQVGDGTTSSVLFTGELLKQAERFASEGLHPRIISEGYDIAKEMVLDFLEGFRHNCPNICDDRELMTSVVLTALKTKLSEDLAVTMASAIVDAVTAVNIEGQPIDLHMVEVMKMQHKSASESRFVRGLVMDHGSRHPNMPQRLEKVRIMIANVSMEYEKTEINAGFFYSSAEQREKLIESERVYTDEIVRKIIAFKRSALKEGETMAIINQKGIDPVSLDMLAKEGVIALRRCKRRNMERLMLACGGTQVNTVDDLDAECLGYADAVYEQTLGDDKFTFVDGPALGKSCTILIRGPNKHTIDQIHDALRDGMMALKGAIEDKCLIPGCGAFEVAASSMLMRRRMAISGRQRLGVEAFASALLIVPKTLAENSGLDVQDCIIKLEEEQERSEQRVGLDLNTGEPILPSSIGVWDSYTVKKQILNLSTVLATQLLLVDEVMKAGKSMGKSAGAPPEMEE